MKKVRNLLSSLVFFVLVVSYAFASEFNPIVSTDWLEKNLSNPKLVIIDIRKSEDFKNGHIPNSVNVMYSVWAIEKAGKKNELPEEDDLQDIISNAGINNDSWVVVVGLSENITELVNMTRVAWTLNYAGFEKVSVLDGGFTKWSKEGRNLAKEPKKPTPGNFKIKINKNIFIQKYPGCSGLMNGEIKA